VNGGRRIGSEEEERGRGNTLLSTPKPAMNILIHSMSYSKFGIN
jgi:hypothetical protein